MSDIDFFIDQKKSDDRFISLCKSGQIENCCHPNALMTLAEYMMDYASPSVKDKGLALIDNELSGIPDGKVRNIARENIEAIKNSKGRDFRF